MRTPGISLTVSLSLSLFLIAAGSLWARITTPHEARLVDNVEPFVTQLGTKVASVEPFTGIELPVRAE